MIKEYRSIDLQLFSQEKTEPATQKKKKEARDKGQVFKSRDLNAVVILVAVFLTLRFVGGYMYQEAWGFTYTVMTQFYLIEEWDVALAYEAMQVTFRTAAKILAPVLAASFLAGILVNMAQVGFLFTLEPLSPKLNKLNPIEGAKKLFSKRSLVELLKSLFKLVIISALLFTVLKNEIYLFPFLVDMSLEMSLSYIAGVLFNLILQAALLLFILGVADYYYQRWEHEQSIKMSKQEVKEEYKQVEGDPQVKGFIKRRQREMANRRMMDAIPQADVVITNPTHYAIALRYDLASMDAPIVTAKGQGHLALRIKALATEHGVMIMEDRELAQILYKTVELNREIPENLYKAVAEVLAFVWKAQGKQVG